MAAMVLATLITAMRNYFPIERLPIKSGMASFMSQLAQKFIPFHTAVTVRASSIRDSRLRPKTEVSPISATECEHISRCVADRGEIPQASGSFWLPPCNRE
jgi:hypothetical protein